MSPRPRRCRRRTHAAACVNMPKPHCSAPPRRAARRFFADRRVFQPPACLSAATFMAPSFPQCLNCPRHSRDHHVTIFRSAFRSFHHTAACTLLFWFYHYAATPYATCFVIALIIYILEFILAERKSQSAWLPSNSVCLLQICHCLLIYYSMPIACLFLLSRFNSLLLLLSCHIEYEYVANIA